MFGLLQALRLDAVLRWRLKRLRAVPILNLHRVSPHANPFWTPLHPTHFEELLVYLRRHFQPVGLSSLQELDTGDGRPGVVLSFDDGYHDFIEYAAPLLQKHQIRANLNVIPACVESGRPIWAVELVDFLNASPAAVIRGIRLPGFSTTLENESYDAKLRYGLALSLFLKSRPRAERMALWPELAARIDATEFPRTRMLTREDIRALSSEHDIGVHSYSHESMGFESDAFFLDDLGRCEDFFRNSLDLPLDTYAFPNGSYRASQIDALVERGFRSILLVEERLARPGTASRGVVPRMTMSAESGLEARYQLLDYRLRGVP